MTMTATTRGTHITVAITTAAHISTNGGARATAERTAKLIGTHAGMPIDMITTVLHVRPIVGRTGMSGAIITEAGAADDKQVDLTRNQQKAAARPLMSTAGRAKSSVNRPAQSPMLTGN